MSILQAIILGVIQGITEFLPVSSSGHLILFPRLFGWPQQAIDFDIAIHVATLLSIIWVLWADLKKMTLGFFRKGDAHGQLGRRVVLATIPIVIAGLLFSIAGMSGVRTVRMVAVNLILWGAILLAADYYSTRIRKKVQQVQRVGLAQAMVIGVSQIISLLPGSSRSGVTMSAGLFAGLDRTTAARFSFLLAVPAIAGAGTLALIDAAQHGLQTPADAMVVGFIAAFFSGAIAIRFLLKLLAVSNYRWFAVYRIVLGFILFFLFFA